MAGLPPSITREPICCSSAASGRNTGSMAKRLSRTRHSWLAVSMCLSTTKSLMRRLHGSCGCMIAMGEQPSRRKAIATNNLKQGGVDTRKKPTANAMLSTRGLIRRRCCSPAESAPLDGGAVAAMTMCWLGVSSAWAAAWSLSWWELRVVNGVQDVRDWPSERVPEVKHKRYYTTVSDDQRLHPLDDGIITVPKARTIILEVGWEIDPTTRVASTSTCVPRERMLPPPFR